MLRVGWLRPAGAAAVVLLVAVVCARSAGSAGGWRRVPVPGVVGAADKVVAVSDSQVWALGSPTLLWTSCRS